MFSLSYAAITDEEVAGYIRSLKSTIEGADGRTYGFNAAVLHSPRADGHYTVSRRGRACCQR
jgi:hypothetical protein